MVETMSGGFQHEAFLYADRDEFLEGTSRFVRDGVSFGEPTLVVVDTAKITALRRALGSASAHVQFLDMAAVGRNPARIIPAWRGFIDAHGAGDRPVRGIGEPMWAERTPEELVECRLHEALLNVAFAESGSFRLLCPYNTATLDPVVIEQAHGTHPVVCTTDRRYASPSYAGLDTSALFSEPLTAPPASAERLRFTTLGPVRDTVRRYVDAAGLAPTATADAVLAVNEVATNSLRYGGGHGTLTVWRADDTLLCQVTDRGRISDPLVGRRAPAVRDPGGRGLWLANQTCRLVQIRSADEGTTMRLHFPGGSIT